MKLCEPGIIDKTRYLVRSGRHIFEVDEFYGENEGDRKSTRLNSSHPK